MLTDERIRELAQDHYSQAYEESLSCGQVEHLRKLRNKDTADALQELLLARQRITELEAESGVERRRGEIG